MSEQITIESKFLDEIIVGKLKARYSVSGYVLRYYIDFRHKKLNLHKEVSAPEIPILQNKVDALIANWDKRYRELQFAWGKKANQQNAEQMTNDEEERRRQYAGILAHTLDIDDAVDWSVLKDDKHYPGPPKIPLAKEYPVPQPSEPFEPSEPIPPTISLMDRLSGNAKRKREDHHKKITDAKTEYRKQVEAYEHKLAAWKDDKRQHDTSEAQRVESAEKEAASEEQEFYARREEINAKVEELRANWVQGNAAAIEEHASIVLDHSDYGDLIEKSFEVAFDPNEKMLIVEYALPTPDDMPVAKNIRYVQRSNEYTRTLLSQKDQKALYDGVCYQICLRTIHEVFEADIHGHIQKIAFNGVVEYVDKATGKQVQSTLLSLISDRAEFLDLNLALIEPKACFKALKGISAASLSGLTPVAPIVEMDKSDRRFIAAQHVLPEDEIATNLAAMNWEEFEHLVRDIFEREFAERGGSVHVTQSSSDGGVDAVAFDPDPISGGKLIIQAKRYTNTVGLSAVRDLYGTTMNEGANKGILVTTADFGPDAHKFASDKPITLMSGNNLLHLLEKHGIKATIDINAARKELGLRARE